MRHRTVRSRPVSDGRLGYLDGVRGLAALYVVISHAWDTVFTSTPGHSTFELATLWMGGGRYAVTIFIVVSGFSLGLNWWRNDQTWPGGARDFVWRRLRRLLPPYWIAIAFSSLVAIAFIYGRSGTLYDGAYPTRWTGILSHCLALQDMWWAGPAGSTAFWSLAVELHIYAAFAVALIVMRRWTPSWMPVYVCLVGLTILGEIGPRHWVVYGLHGLTPSLYAMFLLGLVAAQFAVAAPDTATEAVRRWNRQIKIAAALGVGAFVLCLPAFSFASQATDLVVGPIAAAGLVLLARSRAEWAQAITRSRIATWLGHCSYSLYLVHSVLLEIVWRFAIRPLDMPEPLRLVGELLVGVAVSIAVARMFYRYVERPFMSRRSKPALTSTHSRPAETAIVSIPSPRTPRSVSLQRRQ